MLNNNHVLQSQFHGSGLDGLSQGPHYALQNFQQHIETHNQHLARVSPQGKHGQHPYGARSASVNGPIRRRISRACDQCNQLRTKCDGQHPCAHCIEFGLGCEYQRERKKRGKASRKDLAQKAAAPVAVPADDPYSAASTSSERNQASEPQEPETKGFTDGHGSNESEARAEDDPQRGERLGSKNSEPDMTIQQSQMPGHPGLLLERDHLEGEAAFDPNVYPNAHHHYDQQALEMMDPTTHSAYSPSQCNIAAYPNISYSLQGQAPNGYTPIPPTFTMTTSPLSTYPIPEDGPSPDWMDIPSPSQRYQAHRRLPSHHSPPLRYPVLEPLIPHLGDIIPLSLACDLIDL